MALFNVKVTVDFEYEVEADDEQDAERQGWEYENYLYTGSVYDISVDELDEPEGAE